MQENCLKNRFKRLAHLVGDCQLLQISSKTKHYQIPLIFFVEPQLLIMSNITIICLACLTN